MEFQQHKEFKQFYYIDGNKNILLFIKEFTDLSIKISQLIDVNFNKNFVIIFSYEEYTDIILSNSNIPLSNDVGHSFEKGIKWIENFGADNTIRLINKPEFKFTSNSGNLVGEFSNYRFNNSLDFNTNGNKPTIKYINNNIFLQSKGEIELICDAKYLTFKEARILLSKIDCGCLSFKNERKKKVIQPVTQNITSSFNVLSTHYFDKKQYDNESEIEVFYFPYPQKSVINHSESNQFLTRFELKNKAINANIIDKLANQTILDSPLKAVVGFTKYKDGDLPSEGPFYHFMPYGEVAFKSSETNFKIGSSGTESLNLDSPRLILNFQKDVKVKVNNAENDLEPSLNSISTKPTIKYQSFNLDSEKSPIFKNESPKEESLNEIDMKEIDYASIPFGNITNKPFPIIPTLSFKDNPELFELEEVFKKIRLKAHKEAKAKKANKSAEEIEYVNSPVDYITPQGFQKTSNGYEFISNENGFQFSLENIDTDLDLSLRKDQVFFVLTPALFKEYCKKVTDAKINAKFAINKELDPKLEFLVDLMSSYSSTTPTDSESIIIFKFHKEKLSTLVNDSKRWTNEGLLNYNLDAIKSAIDDNKKFKDDYFESILDDKDWNGILILNIPISDSENLPKIFKGVSSSQKVFKENFEEGNSDQPKIDLVTKLKFQYAAFPINKTEIDNGNSKIKIKSTSFFGLIDYNPFENAKDYITIKDHFKDGDDSYKFVLSKLKVSFANSSIKLFDSFAFLQVPNLFKDSVKINKIKLQNAGIPTAPVEKSNLIRLNGTYQKNSAGAGEISFQTDSLITITLPENDLITEIKVSKIGFNIELNDSENNGNDKFRFNIDSEIRFSELFKELFSVDRLYINNIGLKFDFSKISLPKINFDTNNWSIMPNISFEGKGFLSSFPIKFSYFKAFEFEKIKLPDGKFDFQFPKGDFDFFKFPNFKFPEIKLGLKSTLFSFVFDFDLGTLGNLGALKNLKAQLLIGWTPKGGYVIGFKLNGPSNKGLHLDLFGALKLDVEELSYGKFNPDYTGKKEDCTAYFLRLNDAKLTVFGTQIPKENTTFDGVIISDFRKDSPKKIAWLINLSDNSTTNKLLLGLGQRSGPPISLETSSTQIAIEKSKDFFKADLKDVPECSLTPEVIGYQPERNWFIASEDVMSLISKEWAKIIDLKFIFNDPKLYGLYLGFQGEVLKGFHIDILYKKLSDNLGCYSTEIQLPDDIRNQDIGGASLQLPNIGIEIYTNGDWKADFGFPKNSNDWSRSGFIQLNTAPPFVGWFGFYLKKSNVPSLTLFGAIKLKEVNIIQAGFAMRVGLGAYLNKGILYIGASLSVYGILEGAFAFKKDNGLQALFPDHFAVLGRVGAIAEIVGYVDFKIVKAAVRISVRAEFGLLLIYLGEKVTDIDSSGHVVRTWNEGIQPVKVYVEGEVIVSIRVTLFCVKFFRKKWCLVVRFKFNAYVRFEYIIGGSDSSSRLTAKQQLKLIDRSKFDPNWALESLNEIPMVFIPTFTRRKETLTGKEETILVSNFYIPFFGVKMGDDRKLKPSRENIFKNKIIQPFINDLITKIKEVLGTNQLKYETLREILLIGKLEGIEVNITVPNYCPKFIDRTNEDWETMKSILEKEFLLKKYNDDDELEEFKKSIGYEDCINLLSDPDENKCPYIAIPAPISKNIKVNNNEIKDGFEIKIKGLLSSEVTIPINNIEKSAEYIHYLEEYFNDYKTQFIERKEDDKKLLATNIDLRENFVIPEFFKLAALLTLEKAYSQANPKEKNGEEYNPTVNIINGDLVFNDGPPISTNDHIEAIIGQLNYFYNSGLRLPRDINKGTISINELIGQFKVVTPIINPDAGAWEHVEISIENGAKNYDITNNILGKEGDGKQESVKEIWNFINGLENTDFNTLKNEFEPVKFIRPYKLINVTLAVQSNHKKIFSKVGDKEEANRFYEIPKKLFKNGINNSSNYKFELTAAQYENTSGKSQKDEVTASSFLADKKKLEFAKCLNIEIQVKSSSAEAGKFVLELTNVLADDLTLITLLKYEGFSISNISFYGKIESEGQSKLIKLTETGTTIIKTNLSPRTAPPIFNIESLNKLDEPENRKLFVEDSNNPSDAGKQNFIRLVWEALTTNTGGYYLVFENSSELMKDLKEVVMSFETQKKEVPYFFNSLKIDNIDTIEIIEENNIVKEDLFTFLNDNKLYLYIEQLQQDDEDVLEYYPTMPAHDFGFELLKKQSTQPKYQQYLPLEFGLIKSATGSDPDVEILSMDKVLPIMPKNITKDANGKRKIIKKDKVVYSHISPLKIKVDDHDINNLNRYATVGKHYQLKLGVRDIYGFRTSIDLSEINYKHYYFDKLIPVEAWPLIKFSYWLDSFTEKTDTLYWKLKGYYDIRQILDLAAIPRDGNGENKYRYQFGDTNIVAEDQDKISQAAKGILTTLYNVVAQLTDDNTELLITEREANKKEDKEEIKNKILLLIKDVKSVCNGEMPVKDVSTKPSEFVVKTEGLKENEIENAFSFEISLTRKEENIIHKAHDSIYTTSEIEHTFEDLNSKASIWEYSLVEAVTTKIQASNGTDGTSNLKALNMVVKNKTQENNDPKLNRYSLAISVDKNLDKVIHLINNKALRKLRVNSDYLNSDKIKAERSYLGIKPISNKLWSGSYFHKDITKEFTNIDLDKSFRIVLEKIDELLNKDSISSKLNTNNPTAENPKDLFEKLIAAKKKIAIDVLSNKVDEVMDASINVGETNSITDFKEIVLNKLTNFYAYDGAVALEVDGLEIPSNYRLSISVETVKNYNIISSKINKDKKWNIFFDQEQSMEGDINFSIKPQITHIEKDIQKIKDNKVESEIEKSTWIQLIDPIDPKIKEYKVEKWPKIIREFPLKPIIIKHEAEQSNLEADMGYTWGINSGTKLPKAGEWEYKLYVEDNCENNDRIDVKLIIKNSINKFNNLDNNKTLEGLIAYWASINDKEFEWKDFVNDTHVFFESSKQNSFNETKDESTINQFSIKVTKNENGETSWQEDANLENGLKLAIKHQKVDIEKQIKAEFQFTINGFNIFNREQKLFSVLPIIKVQRNFDVKNTKFHYETDSVEPSTPATPLIKYNKPLGIAQSDTFEKQVFINTQLPYKTTAKYLIDIDANFPKDNAKSLPVIPIRQIESNGNSIENPDAIFSAFDKTNGYFAFTYTIYNSSVTNGDLPIFYAETIFKSKK